MVPPSSPRLGLAQIGQIAVPVRDLDTAVGFYRDVLGMRFLFQAPPGLAFFDCGGVRLLLDGPAAAHAGQGSTIYYKVPDITEAAAVLTDRGVRFEQAPHVIARLPDHDLWMAFFRDPDGNLLALMSEVSR
jgi:methylmalonyl-CoA/ethylmalonyl-CoA epimerase